MHHPLNQLHYTCVLHYMISKSQLNSLHYIISKSHLNHLNCIISKSQLQHLELTKFLKQLIKRERWPTRTKAMRMSGRDDADWATWQRCDWECGCGWAACASGRWVRMQRGGGDRGHVDIDGEWSGWRRCNASEGSGVGGYWFGWATFWPCVGAGSH
jgi:hypothetical protein